MNRFKFQILSALLCVSMCIFLITCTGDDDDDNDEWNPPAPSEDLERDIINTELEIDISALSGTATIEIEGSASTGASFEAGGLGIIDVRCDQGPLEYDIIDGRLDVGIPSGNSSMEVMIDYTFSVQGPFEGYMEEGMTLIWPYYCGNLFPCHSEPFDGSTFQLLLSGIPNGMNAVYPESIPSDAPSYQIAWSIDEYTYTEMGTTDGGTMIALWSLPGNLQNGLNGMKDMVAIFDWYEKNLGPYPFGPKTGAVGVQWPAGAYGGMEHHPYWHISRTAMKKADIQVHEAAHGWYGGGIRIRCWEDFVLSEGTVTYLTARAIGQVLGTDAGDAIWNAYANELVNILNNNDDIAWPEGCGEIDILEDGLFSRVPYIKGAFFYLDVANAIGADTLDQVLSSFFYNYVGEAAYMQDMLDHIYEQTGFDPGDLAEGWLRTLGAP